MRSTQTAFGFFARLRAMIMANLSTKELNKPGDHPGYFNEKVLGGIPYYHKAKPSNGRKRSQSMRSKIRKTKYRRINRAKYAR